jgi:hypothetical protein
MAIALYKAIVGTKGRGNDRINRNLESIVRGVHKLVQPLEDDYMAPHSILVLFDKFVPPGRGMEKERQFSRAFLLRNIIRAAPSYPLD